MKNVLVTNKILTALPENGLAGLNKGELICLTSKGEVATADTFKTTDHIQFVLGLGDGNTKKGIKINGKKFSANYAAYEAPVAKKLVINVSSSPVTYQAGEDAAFVITCYPKSNFDAYPRRVETASVIYQGTGQTGTQLIQALKAEVTKLVDKINKFYGKTVLTATLTDTVFTLTGAVGFDFTANCEGLVVGTLDTAAGKTVYGNIKGTGTGAEVANLEKESAVADMGYDPKKSDDGWYGDIFLADKTKTYDSFVITTQAEQVHTFMNDTEGNIIHQFIAVQVGSTGIDSLKTILGLSEAPGVQG